ncbi:MAG: hypothetical protein CFE24_10230 [Flavobacterium sp. BFFFF2]|nr:MAG: hypothetical protein CFE24_10230 [Flavobacterium sp. BFFFF2]
MNPQVDQYLINGCMRCPLGATPQCKVHPWKEVLIALRQIVLASGLTEEVKWGVPCYTFEGKNVVLISAFKEYVCLSFLNGSLLNDDKKVLVKQGAHSQVARIIKFTSFEAVSQLASIIEKYLVEAISIEKSGQKIAVTDTELLIPEELTHEFNMDLAFKMAFEALTPGRQRGYLIHFTQAKNSQTISNRIAKNKPDIMKGIGMGDAYKGRKNHNL